MPNHKETAVKTAVAERILYEGWSVRQAAKQIDVSKSTVQDWVNRYRKTLSLERRPGSGRKRITTPAVAKNTSQTSCNLKNAVNSPRCFETASNHLQNVSIVCRESEPPGTQEASSDEKTVYRDREKEMCENEEIKVENSNIVYLPVKEEYDTTQQGIPEVKQEHEEILDENEEIKLENLYENDEEYENHQEFPEMDQDIELLIGNVKVELKEENVCENIKYYDNDDHSQFSRKSTTNSFQCYKSSCIHKSHPIFIQERNTECSSTSDKTSDSLTNGTLNSENIFNSEIHTKIKIEDSTFTNSDESSLERQFCTQNIYSDTEDCKFSIAGNGSISQEGDLNQEILKHQCKLFPCTECEKSFSRKDNLNQHMNVYSEDHPFSCEECGKSFPKKRNLQRHNRIHKNIRTQTCNICQKSFAYASALKNHMNVHSKVRFTCDICEKSFSHKCTLENHMLVHGNKLPFQCDICGKSFVTHNLVSRHKRIHTGNFPFSCTLCGKAFNQKCHLKVHLAVHTGDQPFACELCGKSFSRKFNLVRHMSMHNSESSNQL